MKVPKSYNNKVRVLALLKILIGLVSLFALFTLTSKNNINEVVPATTGLKGLIFLGIPALILIWGLIEFVTEKPLAYAAQQWDKYKWWKKLILSLLVIVGTTIILFLFMPLAIYR